MSEWLLVDADTGAFVAGPLVADEWGDPVAPPGFQLVPAAGWPECEYLPATKTLASKSVMLTAGEVVALYTSAEQLRIFSSNVPEVRALVALMQIKNEPIEIGGANHVQGTALIAGLGLLDPPSKARPNRVARILSGQPPETPA